jgi:prepilin-type N-terminal cleavage/methylation domain-containing protein
VQKGFSLIELVVALAVAGILVSSALELYGMFHREYVHGLAAYDSRATEHIHTMQKSIRELRECPDANRL